jgi:glycosyltransferase involved in cell wall biosynthesis
MDSPFGVSYDYQIFSMQVYGGVSRYFVELASHVAQMPDVSVRVLAPIYVNRLLANAETIAKIGLHLKHPIPHTISLLSTLNAVVSRAMMPKLPSDIVHETYYSAARTAPRGAKIVLTVYDLIQERLFPNTSARDGRHTKKLALERADHVICISENTRTDLLSWYRTPPERVSVIHLASSMGNIQSRKPPVSESYILYVGQRGGYKNFDRLLEAIGISKLHRSVKLICFGGGPISLKERRTMSALDIPPDRIEYVIGNDVLLKGYYEHAAAFVYPSLYEGFGIPLLEAMQCGCPVVCSDTDCFKEVAGQAAEYFDPDDSLSLICAITRVLQSPERRCVLVRDGRKQAETFSWQKCARETYSCYRKVLENR